VAYDSSDRRVVYLGFYAAAPFIAAPAPNSGDWIRQVNNALLWSATGRGGPGALIAGCYDDPTAIKRLADTLAMYGGYFSTYDTVNAYTSPPPSAAALWAAGYRAILTYSDFPYSDSLAWGDMLADFVELGGGVVVTCFGDYAGSGYHPAGAWNPRYTLWNLNNNGFTSATLGTVHQPAHPIMSGVTTVGCSNYRTAATTPMSSAYLTRIADWASGNPECVAYDSSDRRVVYLGFYAAAPFIAAPAPNSGDWITQLNNALRWSAEGGVAAVQSPPSAAAGFRVWPNPVRGILNLSLGSAPGDALVRLHDVTGRCVLSRTFSARERAAGVRLDLGDLAAGVYLMKLSAGGVSTAQKLVIQH
jgi:hypothetical protein